MEKIWIQFNGADYQKYHDYCLRYYTIQNTTRKRSIHLFLELFEKDILPVREHDLDEVFLLFSKKCDELDADHNLFGKNDSSINIPQFQVCSDILSLITDLEKIYRLIQKTGLAPNYLLVLATFSKIIDEEKNAYISAVDENNRRKIESFAPSIAEIIRTRLGQDATWESVLHELTRVVRMFNQASPHQKIDQNCIFLLGSAVVSHFNADIGYEEIQSKLERYFEDSELAEFESLLNNTPYLPDNDRDYDLTDYVIFQALKSISCTDIDQEYHKTVSGPTPLKIADIPPAMSRKSDAITRSGRTFPPSPVKRQKKYSGRFDIDISDTSKSYVVSAEKKNNPPYKTYLKPPILQYSLLSAGFVILILFAITIGPAFGIGNPSNNMTHTSTGITGNLSMSAKNVPTNGGDSKTNISVPNPAIKTVLSSANKTNSSVQSLTNKTAVSPADIKTLFMSVAFGPNNLVIQKTAVKQISLSFFGDYDDNDTATVEQFKGQFDNTSYTSKFTSNKISEIATIKMNFLPESSLENIANSNSNAVVYKDPNTGAICYILDSYSTMTNTYITIQVLYINSDFTGDQRKHWILRGLLSELGFVGETTDYPDSIFYSGSNTTAQLSVIDWKTVALMYSGKITPGMSFDRAKSLLQI
jgi:hypothetical protein